MQADARRTQRRRPDISVNTLTTRREDDGPGIGGYRDTDRDDDQDDRDDEPPRTPPNRNPPTGSRAPKAAFSTAHKAADSDTFLEMFSPVDAVSSRENANMPGQRDSHDLSLPLRNVRDSLVSNMLLSLDQFSMGGAPSRSTPAFDDTHLYSLSGSVSIAGGGAVHDDLHRSSTAPSVARYPGAGAAAGMGAGMGSGPGPAPRHGYSYSSDYEAADDASRVSGSVASRGRRSNSSSGFQSSLGRINSMRESLHRGSQPGTPRLLHSRGGKGSKSSSTNSIDNAGYAQVLGSQRWAHGFGGRSSSFDMGSRPVLATVSSQPQLQQLQQLQHPPPQLQPAPPQLLHQQQRQPHQPWHIEFSNTFFSDSYDDAAPMPTVPGGPRKLVSMPSMPSIPSYQRPPPDPVPEHGPERRRSVRSARSATVGRQTQPKYTTAAAAAAAASAPPMPALDIDSAPAPHVGYEKSKEVLPPPTAVHPPQHRDRPGFFRRVFGSFRDTVTGNDAPPPVPAVSQAAADVIAAAAAQAKAQSTPPSRDSHHSSHHATLQKKPSGFFRRRKKSISEAEAPPPLPVPMPMPGVLSGSSGLGHPASATAAAASSAAGPSHAQLASSQPPPQPPQPPPQSQPAPLPPMPRLSPAVDNDKANPSPVTSLRKAMSPYLKGSPSFPNGTSGLGISSPSAVDDDLGHEEDDDDMAFDEGAGPGPELVLSSHHDDINRTVRGFSPDYEPSPNATIRSVGPDPPSHGSTRRLETPTRLPPQPPHPARSGSFLSDNSDSEESPRRRRGSRGPPGSADGKSNSSKLSLPIESTAGLAPANSPRHGGVSAAALPTVASMPSLKASASKPTVIASEPRRSIDEPDFVIGDPTEDDRQKALNIYEGSEDFIQKEKAAAWMGEEGPVRQRTLRAYMDLYDFRNLSVINALRDLCSRLVLRAETQQVDRILVAFSNRWEACNPNHGFKSIDVVHTLCYSILLLNTDLHMADIESKMTRSQFVKNTLTTIRQALAETSPEVFNKRASFLPHKSSGPNLGITAAAADTSDTNSLAPPSSSGLPSRAESPLGHRHLHDDGGPLVRAPFDGSWRAWEAQMEMVLKDTYASIRDDRLPLFGAAGSGATGHDGAGHGHGPSNQSQNNLSVMGMLKRTPSVLSKTPSDSQASTRGRVAESSSGARAGSSRWASKSRSRVRGPMISNGPNGFSSSRTSFEDSNSMWSPTVSSATWSRQSLGRTQTSMSMESFGSSWGRGDYQQSIGFANALSQAIIREDGSGGGGGGGTNLGGLGNGSGSMLGSNPSLGGGGASLAAATSADDQSLRGGALRSENALLDDESLELAGPPWIKEGMVVHKHHLDGLDKKARDRNWAEVFAVVQKGSLSLFSFTPNKSLRAKGRSSRHNAALPKGAVVGGGNWQENATNLGTFSLKQTLASALPPPGYSRQRPHVWALSLPTGAVHLFQVGTPDICKEFVLTANYWSARLSTHPLVGGISNIEYGWSDSVIHNPLVNAISNESGVVLPLPPPGSSSGGGGGGGGTASHPPVSRPGSAATGHHTATVGAGRASLQSRGSFRSGSFDFGHMRSGSSSSVTGGGGGGNGSSSGGGVGSGALGSSRHGKLPGDRIHIAEWTPPTQSLRPSHAGEPQQLQTLLAYVKSIEDELQTHNALRSPMLLAFTPRGHNANKAMANWERKSSYLLREIVKYRTYVDCLTEAERRRAEIYHERDIARRAARGEDITGDSGESGGESDGDGGGHGDGDSDSEAEGDITLRPQ